MAFGDASSSCAFRRCSFVKSCGGALVDITAPVDLVARRIVFQDCAFDAGTLMARFGVAMDVGDAVSLSTIT